MRIEIKIGKDFFCFSFYIYLFSCRSFDRNSNLANQTEFVYTVFVGNKPVLAITAADDMKLVSTEEVMQTIGSSVLTKSERKRNGFYL